MTKVTGLSDNNLIADLYTLSQENNLELQPTQVEMLKMSDSDISNGRLVSEEELMQHDEKWQNSLCLHYDQQK